MKSINLLIGISNPAHLGAIEKLPRAKCFAHFSGSSFDRFAVEKPELISQLANLIKRGQLEILSAGYYEPILSLLPDEDKVGQIRMLNQFITEKFLSPPRGLWLVDQIWEPDFPKIFSRAEIEYALLDEQLFYSAGLNLNNFFGYFITEQEGEITKVFPTHKTISELSRSSFEVIRYLQGIATDAGDLAVVLIYKGENLDELLFRLEENKWIRFMTLSEYMDEYPPRGRIYLPSISFGKGFLKNILISYPEANNLHKKMLYVSNRLHTLLKGKTLIGADEKEKRLNLALRELYKGENGSVYQYCGTSGFYSNRLRHNIYSNLIRSEVEMDKYSRSSSPYAELSVIDLDKDGNDEVILSSNMLNIYFSPFYGGSIFEIDYKPKAFNLVNTLARRNNDQHLRFSLMDHFLSPDTDLNKFSLTDYCEAGDFVDSPYLFMPKRRGAEAGLIMTREGKVEGIPVKIEKCVTILANQSIINIEYKITNKGEEADVFWFAVEYNLSMPSVGFGKNYYMINNSPFADNSLQSIGEIDEVHSIKLVDEDLKIDVSLESNKPMLFWRFPIVTHLPSEKGLKENYQSSSVIPSFKFKLNPGESFDVKMTLRIEE